MLKIISSYSGPINRTFQVPYHANIAKLHRLFYNMQQCQSYGISGPRFWLLSYIIRTPAWPFKSFSDYFSTNVYWYSTALLIIAKYCQYNLKCYLHRHKTGLESKCQYPLLKLNIHWPISAKYCQQDSP